MDAMRSSDSPPRLGLYANSLEKSGGAASGEGGLAEGDCPTGLVKVAGGGGSLDIRLSIDLDIPAP